MKNWGHSSRKNEKICCGKLLTTTEAKNTTEIASDSTAPASPAMTSPESTQEHPNQGESQPGHGQGKPQSGHGDQGEPHTPPRRKSLRRAARLAAAVRHVDCKVPPQFGSHFFKDSPILALAAGHFDVNSSKFLPDITPSHPNNALPSIDKALEHPDWRAAIDAECDGILNSGSVMDCSYKDLPPGAQPMRSHLILKEKLHAAPGKSRHKARLVIDGNNQFPAPTRPDTYASTPSATAIRTLIALAAQDGHSLYKLDFTQAFLQSDPLSDKHQLFVIPPKHLRNGTDHLWKLLRAIYGVGMATQSWQNTLSAYLVATGWTTVCSENVYFVKNDGTTQLRCVVHVDDILLSSPDPQAAQSFITSILERFKGQQEPTDRYVGLQIESMNDSINLHQNDFIQELLVRFGMHDSNPVYTPLQTGTHLSKADCPATIDHNTRDQYRELTGCLQFLAHWSRPDLSHACAQLARFAENPGTLHLQAAKRVLRYLKGTANYKLHYPRASTSRPFLWGSVDSDWGSCEDTRKSYTGIALHLHRTIGAAVYWSSNQQHLVAQSTTEAEFIAASKAANEVVWLRRLLTSWGHPPTAPTPLYEDNTACISTSLLPGQTNRNKHIDIKMHNIKDNISSGTVRLVQCPSHDNFSDALTKCLPKDPHSRHTLVLLGVTPNTGPPLLVDSKCDQLSLLDAPTSFHKQGESEDVTA